MRCKNFDLKLEEVKLIVESTPELLEMDIEDFLSEIEDSEDYYVDIQYQADLGREVYSAFLSIYLKC